MTVAGAVRKVGGAQAASKAATGCRLFHGSIQYGVLINPLRVPDSILTVSVPGKVPSFIRPEELKSREAFSPVEPASPGQCVLIPIRVHMTELTGVTIKEIVCLISCRILNALLDLPSDFVKDGQHGL